jgi:hypothetical protein
MAQRAEVRSPSMSLRAVSVLSNGQESEARIMNGKQQNIEYRMQDVEC